MMKRVVVVVDDIHFSYFSFLPLAMAGATANGGRLTRDTFSGVVVRGQRPSADRSAQPSGLGWGGDFVWRWSCRTALGRGDALVALT